MQTPRHLATVLSTVSWIVACFFALNALHADEAVFPDGQRIEGDLGIDGQSRFVFQPFGQTRPLSLDRLDHVRFPSVRLPPVRAAAPYRVLMRGGQYLTGELLDLGSEKIQFRTAWSKRLAIPRAAVTAVSHAPGFVTIFVDEFENDLKSWRLTGSPVLTTRQHVSGERSLCVDGHGKAEYTVADSLTAGRAGIDFHDRARTKGFIWQLEAEFAGSVGWPTVRVRPDPRSDSYVAEVAGAVTAKSPPPRSEDWQRLNVEFSLDTLALSIDDEVLWSCRQLGAGGALRKVRLSCTRLPSNAVGDGEVFFDDFSLARAVPDLPHPKSESEQDELWLLSGDQLFGDIVDVSGGLIRLHASFGQKNLSWGEVRGIYFRQSGPQRRAPDRMRVRIWLRSGISFEPDVLDGIVRRLDKEHLVLSHEVLGELTIDRKRLHRLRLLAPDA